MIAALRLLTAVVVFLGSLLAVFSAPTYNLWQASIAVTELGFVLALLALVVLLPGWHRSLIGRAAAMLALAAVVLAVSPIVRAYGVARDLPARLTTAFGAATPHSLDGAPALERPFTLGGMLRGAPTPAVVTTRAEQYTSRAGKPLELDLYAKAGAVAATPLIVMIHGGSWRGGDRSDLAPLNSYLAARGYVVAAISYRFAPHNPHPAATDDVNSAIEYLKANGPRFGLDRTRIALIGRSAGGQLALLSAYTKNDPAIRGVVGLYPPSDQVFGYENPSNPRVINSTLILEDYLQGNPKTAPAAYASSSPINFVGPATVPTLLIHGRKDELVFARQSARLTARLASAGRPHLYLELPWATHGCDYFFNGPCGQLSTYAIERFLAAVMR
ncbi:MAG: alpha/beta hydrolase [Gemmatimonadaceae bacterium]|nr:alpha/beta hydrolase [Gemmatimonadaceae bacterium]